MVEKKEKGARDQEQPKSNADSNDVRTEARRKAKEDGRDWQSLSYTLMREELPSQPSAKGTTRKPRNGFQTKTAASAVWAARAGTAVAHPGLANVLPGGRQMSEMLTKGVLGDHAAKGVISMIFGMRSF